MCWNPRRLLIPSLYSAGLTHAIGGSPCFTEPALFDSVRPQAPLLLVISRVCSDRWLAISGPLHGREPQAEGERTRLLHKHLLGNRREARNLIQQSSAVACDLLVWVNSERLLVLIRPTRASSGRSSARAMPTARLSVLYNKMEFYVTKWSFT